MKKLKKILALGLGLLFAFGAVACANNNNDNGDEPVVEIPETIVYADFETWAPDFQLIRVQKLAGVINVNYNSAFAKSGQSMKINPIGEFKQKDIGRFLFPLSSKLFEFDYRNFSTVDTITFEFYNDSEREVKVSVGLTPTISSINEHTYTPYQWQKLAPKSWTTVTYKVDARALSMLYDIKKIEGFYMAFENMRESRDESLAPDIYLDDIVIHNFKYVPPMNETINLAKMEYLDFEDPLQVNALSARGDVTRLPILDIIKASEVQYNDLPLTATSGENILKIEWQRAADDMTVTGDDYECLYFTELIAQNTFLATLKPEELNNLVFCVDFFNACDKDMSIEFDFGQSEESMPYTWDLKPGKWYTMRYTMADVYARFPDWHEYGWVRFVMPAYNTKYSKNKIFYVDNMHFEWASDVDAK